MRRYLVVANRTLGGGGLLDLVRGIASAGPSAFYVIVPAAPPKMRFTWTDEQARSAAAERLSAMLDRLAAVGIRAAGEMGDAQPLLAIGDVLRRQRFDAVVLSTLPASASRWLHLDLSRRVEDTFGLPVLHVVSDAEPSRVG